MRVKKEAIVGFILAAILISLALIFSAGLALAEEDLDAYPVCSQVNIFHPIVVQGAIDAGVTANINIYYSNNSFLVNSSQMTFTGSGFNYTLNSSQTCIRGLYTYDIFATDGTYNTTERFNFIINNGGIPPSEERTGALSRTIWIFFLMAIVCFISFFFVRMFPVKMTLFILMIWFLLMGFNFSFVALQDEIVNNDLENFLEFIIAISFKFHYWLFIILGVFWMITIILNIQQGKIKKRKERFG